MTGKPTGNWKWEGDSVCLLELEGDIWIAAEPRMADELLTAVLLDGEIVTVEYEPWQIA